MGGRPPTGETGGPTPPPASDAYAEPLLSWWTLSAFIQPVVRFVSQTALTTQTILNEYTVVGSALTLAVTHG